MGKDKLGRERFDEGIDEVVCSERATSCQRGMAGFAPERFCVGRRERDAQSPYKGGFVMMPIGPLMIEHRLIERMIELLRKEASRIEETKETDPVFLDTAVDFIRTYADRTHHGKEEGILFRELLTKNMSQEHQDIMAELIEGHKYGREVLAELVEARQRYLQGHADSLGTILDKLRALVEFYPEHIRKEDKEFFLDSMGYFDEEEKEAMLQECWEFDRKMIHEKYSSVVKHWENEAKG
jgi:hemerythrin-like domain-containing protein